MTARGTISSSKTATAAAAVLEPGTRAREFITRPADGAAHMTGIRRLKLLVAHTTYYCTTATAGRDLLQIRHVCCIYR